MIHHGGTLKKLILVVDNEKHILGSIKVALKMEGYEVIIACDGQEALSKIFEAMHKRRKVDLLITDLQMSKISGIELISYLKAVDADLPVMIITGYRDREFVKKLSSKKNVDCLDKPFGPDELVNHVNIFFSGVTSHD